MFQIKPTTKKILLIIAFVLVVIILAYLLYRFFFQPAPHKAPATNVNAIPTKGLPEAPTNANRQVIENINIALPEAEEIKLPPDVTKIARGGKTLVTTLTSTNIQNFNLAGDGKSAVFYHKDSGYFYRINPKGEIQKMSDQIFHNVENVTWSKDTNKAILEYPDGSNIVYNFKTGKQVTLPSHWTDFSFSPNTEQIVSKSIGIDRENRWIIVSKDDGSAAKKVEFLGSNWNVDVEWSPNNQIIATYHESYGYDRERLFFIGLHGENFKHTILRGRGFKGKWSPDGSKLLYSVYTSSSGLRPQLWIVNAQGESIGTGRTYLGLQTLVNKCAFASNETIYCGVPQTVPEGAGLFKDILNTVPDDIYRVNLSTGAKTLIAQPYGDFTIDEISITSDEKYLYFTDKQSKRLYKIQLK